MTPEKWDKWAGRAIVVWMVAFAIYFAWEMTR